MYWNQQNNNIIVLYRQKKCTDNLVFTCWFTATLTCLLVCLWLRDQEPGCNIEIVCLFLQFVEHSQLECTQLLNGPLQIKTWYVTFSGLIWDFQNGMAGNCVINTTRVRADSLANQFFLDNKLSVWLIAASTNCYFQAIFNMINSINKPTFS